LILEGKDIGSVDYEIDVHQRGNLKEGRGIMKADGSILWRFFNSDSATLQLEDGGEVAILPDHLDLQGGQVTFVTTGKIPGF
jgi:hypothetical protein